MNTDTDHSHECRNCGGTIECFTPNEECDDIPNDGRCEDCERKEQG